MVLHGDHERRVHPADLDQIVDLAGLGRQDLADRCDERPQQDESKQPPSTVRIPSSRRAVAIPEPMLSPVAPGEPPEPAALPMMAAAIHIAKAIGIRANGTHVARRILVRLERVSGRYPAALRETTARMMKIGRRPMPVQRRIKNA